MVLIALSVLVLLLFIGGAMATALAPQFLLAAIILFTLLLLAGGAYQIAGPRPRSYRREIGPAERSTVVFSTIGGLRYPFFYEQKIPTPTSRAATRRTKTRGGAQAVQTASPPRRRPRASKKAA